MEILNLDFKDSFSRIKSLLWILSILSWLFFLCTGLSSIKFLNKNYNKIIWTIKTLDLEEHGFYDVKTYYPLQINYVVLYIIFILTLFLAVVGFFIYIIKSTCKKEDNNNIFEGMMGIWPRLHSFPLIIISFIFLLGEYFYPLYLEIENEDYQKYFNRMKELRIFGLAFSLIALISLIFIYIVTDLKTDEWYIVLTIKKGTYSCLIIFLWYYFFYTIYQLSEYIYPDLSADKDRYLKNTLGIGFSSIIGIGSLAFSFFFKDIIAALMNLLIYLGMAIYFFAIDKKVKDNYSNKVVDGIIDIVHIAFSAGMIVFLLIKYRKECFQSSNLNIINN